MSRPEVNPRNRQTQILQTEPVYAQLQKVFRDRVQSQVWKAGHILPNELDLAAEFGVSVGTVRKAMGELVLQGLVVRQQGRGTFVAERTEAATNGLFDRLRTASGEPIEWDRARPLVEFGDADDGEAEALRLSGPDRRVVRLDWAKSSRRHPLVYQILTLPLQRFPVNRENLAHLSRMTEFYAASDVIFGRADARLGMRTPPKRAADFLNVDPSVPMFAMQRTTFDINEVPVETCLAWLSLDSEYYSCVHTARG